MTKPALDERLDPDVIDGIFFAGIDPRFCRCDSDIKATSRFLTDAQGYLMYVNRAPADDEIYADHDTEKTLELLAFEVLRAGSYTRDFPEMVRLARRVWGPTARDPERESTPEAQRELFGARVRLEKVLHRGMIAAAAQVAGRVVVDRLIDVAPLAEQAARTALAAVYGPPSSGDFDHMTGLALRREAARWGAQNVPGVLELARSATTPSGGNRWACLDALIRSAVNAEAGTGSERLRAGRARRELIGV